MKRSPFQGEEVTIPVPSSKSSVIYQEDPKLLWASIPEDETPRENDVDVVPSYPLIKRRREHFDQGQLALKAFCEKVQASKRLWILDTHFGKENLSFLSDHMLLSPINDFHLITAENGVREVFKGIRENLIKKDPYEEFMEFGITEIDRREFPYLHDRFAVTDDELWHFGGTVGCLQAAMTAVSRGWNAEKRQFIDFFERVRGLHNSVGGSR